MDSDSTSSRRLGMEAIPASSAGLAGTMAGRKAGPFRKRTGVYLLGCSSPENVGAVLTTLLDWDSSRVICRAFIKIIWRQVGKDQRLEMEIFVMVRNAFWRHTTPINGPNRCHCRWIISLSQTLATTATAALSASFQCGYTIP